MPKLNGVSENILYLIALAKGKFVGAFQKCLHIEALEKAKPYPHFQNLPPASKKKKPLSRRGNHALIAAYKFIFYFDCFLKASIADAISTVVESLDHSSQKSIVALRGFI